MWLLLAENLNLHHLLQLWVCVQETQQGHGARGCLELFLGRAEEHGTSTPLMSRALGWHGEEGQEQVLLLERFHSGQFNVEQVHRGEKSCGWCMTVCGGGGLTGHVEGAPGTALLCLDLGA